MKTIYIMPKGEFVVRYYTVQFIVPHTVMFGAHGMALSVV